MIVGSWSRQLLPKCIPSNMHFHHPESSQICSRRCCGASQLQSDGFRSSVGPDTALQQRPGWSGSEASELRILPRHGGHGWTTWLFPFRQCCSNPADFIRGHFQVAKNIGSTGACDRGKFSGTILSRSRWITALPRLDRPWVCYRMPSLSTASWLRKLRAPESI